MAAPQPKQKKIKLSNYATYDGMVLKKEPKGAGKLYPCNLCVVTGTFNGNKISNGKIVFNDHKFAITGEFTFMVTDKEKSVIIVNSGKLNNTKLQKNTPINFNKNNYIFEYIAPSYPKLPKVYYELLKQFAGATKYKRETDGRTKNIYNGTKHSRSVVSKSTYMKVNFAGGTTARYEISGKLSSWSRPNGDFINFASTSEGVYEVSKYRVTVGNLTVANTDITYTFENGNKYTGAINEPSLKELIDNISLEKLVNYKGFSWKWEDLKEKALDGVVVYPDGKSEDVVNGVTTSETVRTVVARKAEEARIAKEKEEKRKTEAARKAAEAEAKKKAEEARIAAEKEAKRKAEEARIAAENAAKKKAEEDARKAAEAEAKKKAEEARIAKEKEEQRKAEEARVAAENEAKRKAEEEARIAAANEAKKRAEEDARKAAEDEARIAAENEAKRRAEEARIAAENEAKRRSEEEARIAAENEAKRRAEEARLAEEAEAERKAEMARIAAEKEAKKKADMARMAARAESRAQESNTVADKARIAAEKEAKMRADMARAAAEQASIVAAKEAKKEAEEARITAEFNRATAEKAKAKLMAAFDFMVSKKSATGISQDGMTARYFYHPKFNPYSTDFRTELSSRLARFCPCVGYDIVSINANSVACNLKKREADGSVSIYRLVVEHDGGVLNVTSFDIYKAKRIE